MKNKFIVLVLGCLLCANIVQAQTEHLKFKGVPIDGTLAEYKQALIAKGFKHIYTKGGTSMLQGNFAGYPTCYVGIKTLESIDIVNCVMVMFPERDTWNLLYTDYSTLKSMLIQKYGEPFSVVENFNTSFPISDDIDRMFNLRMDRCHYVCTFAVEEGSVELSIYHDNNTCLVMLQYFDKQNTEIIRSHAIDDL